jgi:hypothetical protein
LKRVAVVVDEAWSERSSRQTLAVRGRTDRDQPSVFYSDADAATDSMGIDDEVRE